MFKGRGIGALFCIASLLAVFFHAPLTAAQSSTKLSISLESQKDLPNGDREITFRYKITGFQSTCTYSIDVYKDTPGQTPFISNILATAAEGTEPITVGSQHFTAASPFTFTLKCNGTAVPGATDTYGSSTGPGSDTSGGSGSSDDSKKSGGGSVISAKQNNPSGGSVVGASKGEQIEGGDCGKYLGFYVANLGDVATGKESINPFRFEPAKYVACQLINLVDLMAKKLQEGIATNGWIGRNLAL